MAKLRTSWPAVSARPTSRTVPSTTERLCAGFREQASNTDGSSNPQPSEANCGRTPRLCNATQRTTENKNNRPHPHVAQDRVPGGCRLPRLPSLQHVLANVDHQGLGKTPWRRTTRGVAHGARASAQMKPTRSAEQRSRVVGRLGKEMPRPKWHRRTAMFGVRARRAHVFRQE